MFDLEKAVLQWRERQEGETSLAPCELDELEDHLRARFDLELDLDATLAPATAFAIARRELGEAATLSKEFAKAGKSRWKRLMVAGWTLFGGSFFLPVVDMGWLGTFHGWEFVWDFWVFMVPNALMLLTFMALQKPRSPLSRWLARLMAGVSTVGLGFGLYALVRGVVLGPGLYVWAAAFMCAAVALRKRDRDGESARVKAVSTSA